jgi:hypothetical protein
MEQKEEIKVAVLEEQMKTVVKGLDAVALKIDNLSQKIDDSYMKKEEFNRFKNDEFTPMQNNYDKLLWWIIATLLSALGGLILSVINYLTAHHL